MFIFYSCNKMDELWNKTLLTDNKLCNFIIKIILCNIIDTSLQSDCMCFILKCAKIKGNLKITICVSPWVVDVNCNEAGLQILVLFCMYKHISIR